MPTRRGKVLEVRLSPDHACQLGKDDFIDQCCGMQAHCQLSRRFNGESFSACGLLERRRRPQVPPCNLSRSGVIVAAFRHPMSACGTKAVHSRARWALHPRAWLVEPRNSEVHPSQGHCAPHGHNGGQPMQRSIYHTAAQSHLVAPATSRGDGPLRPRT